MKILFKTRWIICECALENGLRGNELYFETSSPQVKWSHCIQSINNRSYNVDKHLLMLTLNIKSPSIITLWYFQSQCCCWIYSSPMHKFVDVVLFRFDMIRNKKKVFSRNWYRNANSAIASTFSNLISCMLGSCFDVNGGVLAR